MFRSTTYSSRPLQAPSLPFCKPMTDLLLSLEPLLMVEASKACSQILAADHAKDALPPLGLDAISYISPSSPVPTTTHQAINCARRCSHWVYQLPLSKSNMWLAKSDAFCQYLCCSLETNHSALSGPRGRDNLGTHLNPYLSCRQRSMKRQKRLH